MNKIVFEREGKWYFYDESYDEYGPFNSSADASIIFEEHCHRLEIGESKVINELILALANFQTVIHYGRLALIKDELDEINHAAKVFVETLQKGRANRKK